MTSLHNRLIFFRSIQKNRKIVLGLSLTFIILFSEITVVSAIENHQIDSPLHYIILFNRPSLIEMITDAQYRTERDNVFLQTPMAEQLKEFFTNITIFHNEIIQRMVSSTVSDTTFRINSMLTWFLNGCIVETSHPSTIASLQQIPGIIKIIEDENRVNIQSTEPKSDPLENEVYTSSVFQDVTGKNVTIAIFDTGVDYTHPALKDNYLGGYDFVNDDSNPFDDHGHGTHVAGIAIGRTMDTNEWNGGIAPDTKFYSYKVMDEQGVGSISSFLQAFEYALDPNQDGDPSDKVDIISISAGDAEGSSEDLLSQAANNAVKSGILVVAAAGNSGPEESTISSPGIGEYVIAVGAATEDHTIASFSSRGSCLYDRVKPDVLAPGVQINSTWPSGTYKILSGTSMATPYVAGYCARILEQHPEWTPLEVIMALRKQTTSFGYDLVTQGYGYLDTESYAEITETPPVAWIHTINTTNSNELIINGTVQGTSVTSYQYLIRPIDQNTEWDQIQTTLSDGLQGHLGTIDVSKYASGTYLLKLQVTAGAMITSDYFFISLEKETNQTDMNIIYPEATSELTEFSVQIHTPTPSFILSIFLVPLRPPQIRIGSDVSFKAPSILKESISSTRGTLLVITPNPDTPLLTKKTITIINT